MTEPFVVRALGLRVHVEFQEDLDEDRLDRMTAAWSGARAASGEPADLTVPFTVGSDLERAMERLTVEVTLAALDAQRGRMLMFHAAGVTDDHGRVVAFVGPSGRGKTTLSRALGQRWGYVSDETIAVDEALRVHPYRKPLSVVRAGGPKKQVSPADAGLRELPDVPLRLAGLALMDRDSATRHPELTAVPLVEALPELVAQMSYLRDLPRPLQTIARLCDAVGGVRRLRYPDATTVPPLLDELAGSSAETSEWAPVPAASEEGPYLADHVDDAILTDGFVIVMADAVLHVLDGIAPVIWLAAARGDDLDAIVDGVIAVFGEPPEGDARALVQAALEELIGAGVLRRR